jgi:uncharacterized protein (DUF885 family)
MPDVTLDTRPEPRTRFDHALRDLLDALFEAQPTWATYIGYHEYDDRWPDVSDAGTAAHLAMLRDQRDRLNALSDTELSPSEQIDRGIAMEHIEAAEFELAELREQNWNALSYVYLAGSGLLNVLAREYAPWAHRGRAFAARVRGLSQMLDGAVKALTGTPDMPVSLLHTETAIAQAAGISELINDGLAEARNRANADEATDDDRAIAEEMAAAAQEGLAAVDEFVRRLRDEVAPRAEGEGRLGRDLFQRKLRHTLSSDLPVEDLLERARRDYDLVRGEILRLAQEAWNEWLPGQTMPTSDDETIRKVIDAISREHRQPGELLEWCQAEVKRLEEFCREKNVIGLPDEPLSITWTPVFMRAYGRAFLESPGPLDKGLSSYFWITPPDETAGPQAVESYLREDNDRMLQLLCIHEGVPGHYLQLAWSNRTPNLARSVFASGAFAEGWAVYITQVMMDLGYGGFESALHLIHWKFYLRSITNALMDIAIHAQGMTEEQAMDLMVGGGFQEEDEARAKWLRARLTSTQLSTYYVGSIQFWDMEALARRRAAEAAGEGAGSVPDQRIAGGIGETAGFDYRAFLESAISHGTPPIKWVSRILFGE